MSVMTGVTVVTVVILLGVENNLQVYYVSSDRNCDGSDSSDRSDSSYISNISDSVEWKTICSDITLNKEA